MKKYRMSFIISVFLLLSIFFIPSTTVYADDHGDDFGSATSVSIGSVTGGVLDQVGDQGFFRFTVSQAGIYLFSSRGIASGNNLNFTLFNSLCESPFRWNAYNGGVGSNFRLDIHLSPGTHYVQISDRSPIGPSGSLHSVHLSLLFLGPFFPLTPGPAVNLSVPRNKKWHRGIS